MTIYEDEIDLRPYLIALIRSWWLIALLILLAGVAGLVYSMIQPRGYESTATILLTRSRARLSLAEQFPTVSDPTDTKSRMDALISITESDAIALATLQTLNERLPAESHILQNFKHRIEVSTTGDVIQVTAIEEDPELAAAIANAWASEATSAINRAYSGQQPIPEIQAEMGNARGRYEEAQSTYESFIEGNQITLLKAQVAELQSLLATIAGDRSWQFSFYSQRVQHMDQIVSQAEALKRQVESGSESGAAGMGDALAVLLARALAFGVNPLPVIVPDSSSASLGSSSNPRASQSSADQTNPAVVNPGPLINLQLDRLSDLIEAGSDYQNDLDSLIEGANTERESAQVKLEQLAGEVVGGEGSEMLIETAAQLRQVEERLENETARERVLLGERDLAWEAYQALSQKETELISASQVTNEVALAGAAVPPQRQTSRGTIRNTMIAGVVGLILAVFGVVAVEWWRSSDFMGSKITVPVSPEAKESTTD